MPLQPGDIAPDFTLFSSSRQEITLSACRDKNVLLLFFPLAFTSVCTRELCSMRDNLAAYNQASVTVFGISVDSLYTLARFKEEQRLNFELLSDFNRIVSAAYDCLYPVFNFGMQGVSKRAAFLVDHESVIRYAEVLEDAKEVPDFGTISRLMGELMKN